MSLPSGGRSERGSHVGIPLDAFHSATSVGLPPYLERPDRSVAPDSSYDPDRLHTPISSLLHLLTLGLRLNGQKSVLTPAQQTIFLGVCLDSTLMQACLAPARVESIQSCAARFKLGRHVSVGLCSRLLGLMAAASPVLRLGLLHRRPFLCFFQLLLWVQDRSGRSGSCRYGRSLAAHSS